MKPKIFITFATLIYEDLSRESIYYLCTVETFCDFLLWQELFIRFPVQ